MNTYHIMGKHLDQTFSNLPQNPVEGTASLLTSTLQEHGWLIRGLESPGAPIIAPGESYREATQGHGAGDLYEVHALQAGEGWRFGEGGEIYSRYSRRFETATARTASLVTANDVGH